MVTRQTDFLIDCCCVINILTRLFATPACVFLWLKKVDSCVANRKRNIYYTTFSGPLSEQLIT